MIINWNLYDMMNALRCTFEKYDKRSATIVLAYLVEHEGLTLAEAVVKVFMIIDIVVLGGPSP